jgi:hypothetical protein
MSFVWGKYTKHGPACQGNLDRKIPIRMILKYFGQTGDPFLTSSNVTLEHRARQRIRSGAETGTCFNIPIGGREGNSAGDREIIKIFSRNVMVPLYSRNASSRFL